MVLYTAAKELIGTPPEFKVFDLALDKLREDPRITLLIGPAITGAVTQKLTWTGSGPERCMTAGSGCQVADLVSAGQCPEAIWVTQTPT